MTIALILITISCKNQNAPQVPPNVLMILTDDQGWGDLSINGNRWINTPNIDQLSEDGVSVDRFYVSPLCAPTRASLLTGKYHVSMIYTCPEADLGSSIKVLCAENIPSGQAAQLMALTLEYRD